MRAEHDHHSIHTHERSYQWELGETNPFDEAIVSWNCNPVPATLAISISIKLGTWSNWLPYAEWGALTRRTFESRDRTLPVRIFQDTVEILNGQLAHGIRIQVTGSDLSGLTALHVCLSHSWAPEERHTTNLSNVQLAIDGLSQMSLPHPRASHLCSATATTAALQFLTHQKLCPMAFAENAHDQGFDLYGNWIFNVAHAYTLLPNRYRAWVGRLNSFNELHRYLKQGTPVIMSVRSPLPGSAQAYPSGHLIAVTGYDSANKQVTCIDPAFPTDATTVVHYHVDDLVAAWARRRNTAYLFEKIKQTR
jgi:hypothetical protein